MNLWLKELNIFMPNVVYITVMLAFSSHKTVCMVLSCLLPVTVQRD
jgi:hypothetical protein